MKNILFRCDGSSEIGMGHVVRCLALADKLKEDFNCDINFLMSKSEIGIKKVKFFYNVIEPPSNNYSYQNWLLESINSTNASVLILDVRDGLSKEAIQQVKEITNIKIVSIDDPEEKRLSADLLFYPPVLQLKQMNWEGFNGDLKSGWEYVLLRKEFLIDYERSFTNHTNIIVSMGSTDPFNMTSFVLNSLLKLNEVFHVTIILGDGNKFKDDLEIQLSKTDLNYSILVNPLKIAEVFSQCDFAIISFGQTAYELAALKIPAIYICLTADHEESSKIFSKNNIGYNAGQFKKINMTIFAKKILEFIRNRNKLHIMKKSFSFLNISDMSKISKKIINI